jgi:CheY-like chemotaxis protein
MGDRMTKTILLADDSLTIQKVVELTFADTPYNVVAVSSGDELLDKIPEVQPELIICDIIMPGRDGYDVCQDIKSTPDTLHIPVILLSGTFEPLDRDRALAVGCSEILTKPFEARKLIEAVERLLRRGEEGEAPSTAGAASRSAETGPVSLGSEGRTDFGTRLAAAGDEPAMTAGDVSAAGEGLSDGLDFTETGFAEMEAAAVSTADRRSEMPRDGLEFEIGGGGDIDPFADLDSEPSGSSDDSAFADALDAGGEPFADVDDEIDEPIRIGSAFDASEPFVVDEAVGLEVADDDVDVVTTIEAEAFADASAMREEPGLDEGLGDLMGEPEFQLESAEDAFGDGSALITDADTAPLPPLEATADQPPATPSAEPPAGTGRLSDDDIDRIARRLLELADAKIEQIAWEVIPDIAEIVVRERIRKLEAELETES